MTIIRMANVSKCFHIQPDRPRSFQDLALGFFRRSQRRPREEFWALKDVSFTVDAGETLGIIGSNGSGKSTCLKLLTRIIEPTSGTVQVQGRVSALLELGAGFHPELTGRENVFLNGSVLGMRRREMARRFDDIVAFAELERFIDVPVKFYSSGMYVRLAFATAINVDPDILLVDEVLAVGDQSFQDKCLERIHELQARGVTIVYVSHGLDAVRSLCTRTLWLDDGVLREHGFTDMVITRYVEHVHAREEEHDLQRREQERRVRNGTQATTDLVEGGSETKQAQPNPEGADQVLVDGIRRFRQRWGTREAEIVDVRLLNQEGRDSLALTTGQPATIVIRYRAHTCIQDPVFGVAVYRDDGLHIGGSNTFLADLAIPEIEGEGEMRYKIDRLSLLEGTFYLSVALHDADQTHTYDYHELFYRFRVHLGDIKERYGTVYIPGRWEHASGHSQGTRDANG
jgi:ABC-type polysaccharide/polyol phosphate transport system ATPase subunit